MYPEERNRIFLVAAGTIAAAVIVGALWALLDAPSGDPTPATTTTTLRPTTTIKRTTTTTSPVKVTTTTTTTTLPSNAATAEGNAKAVYAAWVTGGLASVQKYFPPKEGSLDLYGSMAQKKPRAGLNFTSCVTQDSNVACSWDSSDAHSVQVGVDITTGLVSSTSFGGDFS